MGDSQAHPVTFEDAWEEVTDVPGWMTRDQGRVLWDAALRVGQGGRIVEIGSHQGRSTVILGHAARRVGATVVAIDPFVDGKMFGGSPTRAKFERNIRAAGCNDVVELIAGYSTKLRPGWQRPIALLYIDGKHDYWTFTDDLLWSRHLLDGGDILVHDCFSSIGVTSGVALRILPSSRFRYLERTGSLARFQLAKPNRADRLRILAELPWFLRNFALKVLLRLRLYPVARALGHHERCDPY